MSTTKRQRKPFNKLTPAQDEALSVLSEECAEVVQIVAKIQRHGLHSYHPQSGEENTRTLGSELGDVLAAIKLVQHNAKCDEYSDAQLKENCIDKLDRVGKYLHHAKVPTI